MAMYTRPRLAGCCGTGPALGQLDAGVSVATTAPESDGSQLTPSTLFALSVGAGLTVWLVTKLLGKKRGP